MPNRKQIIIAMSLAIILGLYYYFQAPYFNKGTSPYALWANQQITQLDSQVDKKNRPAPNLEISAINSASNKHFRLRFDQKEHNEQAQRLLKLSVEANFPFQFETTAPNAAAELWVVSVYDQTQSKTFYAIFSQEQLQKSAAGLNFLQLMSMWSK